MCYDDVLFKDTYEMFCFPQWLRHGSQYKITSTGIDKKLAYVGGLKTENSQHNESKKINYIFARTLKIALNRSCYVYKCKKTSSFTSYKCDIENSKNDERFILCRQHLTNVNLLLK